MQGTALLFVVFGVAWGGAPSQLLVDLKASPSLGVSTRPTFHWAVGACEGASDVTQTSYSIVVTASATGAAVWRSGSVSSGASVAAFGGEEPLNGSSSYDWSVATTGPECGRSAAGTGSFVTGAAFHANASFVWTKTRKNAFSFFRGVVPGAADAFRATLYASGLGDDFVLCAYKIFLDGALLGCGPGRGEAPLHARGTNATYEAVAYDSYDVTEVVKRGQPVAVAIEGVASKATKPQRRGVLLQVDVEDSRGTVSTYFTDETWLAYDADAYLRPTMAKSWYQVRLENADGRLEPGFDDGDALAWRAAPLGALDPRTWTAAVAVDDRAPSSLFPKMARPVRLVESQYAAGLKRLDDGAYFGDFGREFEGGLSLAVDGGVDGVVLEIETGESQVNGTVGDSWGFKFNVTLRRGKMRVDQHQYMEFRYVNVRVLEGDFDAAASLTLTAWSVEYPYDARDSSFTSSDLTLNKVYELARWTLEAGVVDTFTDSNTRERRPYEADELCAASARLWVQGDAALQRHTTTYVLEAPTWPVEWQQMTPLLAWMDYMATGETVVAEAYKDVLRNLTHYPADADGLGLLNCSKGINKCGSPPAGPGHHIVDWFPGPSGTMFRSSDHLSVDQAFALNGLRKLSTMLNETDAAFAAAVAEDAATLARAVAKHMWNETAQRFCDGACDDVDGHVGVTTTAWFLYNDAMPDAARAGACRDLAAWGLEGFGSYGSFIFLSALAACDTDGAAMLEALTKCDTQSWCDELANEGATMTRESWVAGTWSHPWGTAAVVGASAGIAGVRQTGPAWRTFEVKPKLANLTFLNLIVPTIAGPVAVNATPDATSVVVPPNTKATLCVRGTRLTLDGEPVRPGVGKG